MSSKSGSKSKENSESWESLFRKTLSKDRLLTFTRPVENPIHWIHLLDPFDQQDTRTTLKSTATREESSAESSPRNIHSSGDKLPHLKFPEAVIALAQAAAKASGESRASGSLDLSGWPLIPFSKGQMFKCEKCCMEFCSPVNHRRHLRVIHRRAPHTEKEDLKSQRQQLATFWDSLSPLEASRIVDMKNIALEDLAGEKVARALSQLLQQPGLFALPHSYVKSGAMLLELVQCRSSRLLLTSSELFKILDGSSEKTFPSFGLNAMQRYVFEGGAGKVGLEAKNLVSSLGFLVELNLVKAFIKDKDEEAWRCQTALVEEEEAYQRKRAQLQEKKRMRKARQRDSKEKEHKPSDFTVVSPFPSTESSDDDEMLNSKPAVGCDISSGPLTNAFENLFDRLAGDESISDHSETVSTTMLDSYKFTSSLEQPGESDNSSHHVEGMANVVCHVSEEELAHDSTMHADKKDLVVGLENTSEGRANDSLNEGVVQATSGMKPLSAEKRNYPATRSFEERELLVSFQKKLWKERHYWGVRSFLKQTVAKEGVELVPEDSAFRPRLLLGKNTRNKKHSIGGQTGVAVWTKKAPKCSDTACDKTGISVDCTDIPSEDMPQACVQGPETSADVAAVDSSQDRISSSTGCVLSAECGCGSFQSSNLASNSGDKCSVACQFSPALPSDLGHFQEPYQAGKALSSLSPMVVGTVVIGSLSVSLADSCQDQTTMQLKSPEDTIGGMMVVEASEEKPTGLVQSSRKLESSVQALHENGAVNCVHHKESEKDAKAVKLASQIDSEGKENYGHFLNLGGEGKFSRPIVAQGGNPRGGRLKMWRPVVSTNLYESHSRSVNSCPLQRDVVTPTVMSTVVGEESNKSMSIDLEEVLQNVEDLEGECAPVGHKIEEVVVGGGSISETTLEAVTHFLIQRWSAAVDDPDTVVYSVEDKDCQGRNDGLREETDEHDRNSENPPMRESKGSYGFPGNGKLIRGCWKQSCPSSGASLRINGKNSSLPGAPRVAGYRYVPK